MSMEATLSPNPESLASGLARRSSAPPRPRQNIIVRLGKKLRHPVNRSIARYSLVSNAAILAPSDFPWIEKLEAQFPHIRDEALKILEREQEIPSLASVSRDQRRIAAPDKWKSYFLYGFGYRAAKNCAACPNSAAAVAAIPGLVTAYFSILKPGTHIPRHRGISKALLTVHLGISVPEPKSGCRMNLDGSLIEWEAGRAIVFDDTYYHEVWNDTAMTRVVLLLHVKRPARLPGRLIGAFFLKCVRCSSYVQSSRKFLAGDGVPCSPVNSNVRTDLKLR